MGKRNKRAPRKLLIATIGIAAAAYVGACDDEPVGNLVGPGPTTGVGGDASGGNASGGDASGGDASGGDASGGDAGGGGNAGGAGGN